MSDDFSGIERDEKEEEGVPSARAGVFVSGIYIVVIVLLAAPIIAVLVFAAAVMSGALKGM
jgi:pilus assembly protein TadC